MGKILSKTLGQIAYEEDIKRFPFYHDGMPRLTWERLENFQKRTWEKNPTPRAIRAS